MIKTTQLMVGSTAALAGLITVLTLNLGATPELSKSTTTLSKEAPQSAPRERAAPEFAPAPVNSSDAFLSNSMGNSHVESTTHKS